MQTKNRFKKFIEKKKFSKYKLEGHPDCHNSCLNQIADMQLKTRTIYTDNFVLQDWSFIIYTKVLKFFIICDFGFIYSLFSYEVLSQFFA